MAKLAEFSVSYERNRSGALVAVHIRQHGKRIESFDWGEVDALLAKARELKRYTPDAMPDDEDMIRAAVGDDIDEDNTADRRTAGEG
jgi:hypothetical protein